jgi:hypothetical protein
VGNQEALTVRRLAPAEAAQALAGCEALDPRGLCAAGDIEAMCERGQCFGLAGPASAVYVLTVRNGVVWVDALKGAGDVDITAAVDEVLTAQAEGAEAIGLQTRRRGLVRKLQQRGYRVTGWVMRKELQ